MTEKEIDGVGFFEGESWSRKSLTVYRRFALNHKAEIATRIIEQWTAVAAIPDDEDSAGRQKLRMQTPAELVSHACETADLLVGEFLNRNWLLHLPEPKVVEKEAASR